MRYGMHFLAKQLVALGNARDIRESISLSRLCVMRESTIPSETGGEMCLIKPRTKAPINFGRKQAFLNSEGASFWI